MKSKSMKTPGTAVRNAASGSTASCSTVPRHLVDLKEAYLAEPLQRDTTTAQPLAEALTNFFSELLPDTERKSLHTLTKFCLMELTLVKLVRAGREG